MSQPDEEIDIAEFEKLAKEFRDHVEKLKRNWVRENKPPAFRDVFEILRQDQRKELDQYMKKWDSYITPIAEAWWKERSYGVEWPDDNSKPVGYYKL